MTGTNIKLKRLREWLGLSLREQDALLEYKPGRSATYERNIKPVRPSREHLAKLRDLAISRKGMAPGDDWYFDSQDTQVSDIDTQSSRPDTKVPHVGYVPGPKNQQPSGRSYKARVDFDLPAGAVYYNVADGSLAPYLLKGYLLLAVPVDRPGHEALCVVESSVGELDVYEAKRSPDGCVFASITTVQSPAVDKPSSVKQIVEVIMHREDSKTVVESETGVTLKALAFVLEKEKTFSL